MTNQQDYQKWLVPQSGRVKQRLAGLAVSLLVYVLFYGVQAVGIGAAYAGNGGTFAFLMYGSIIALVAFSGWLLWLMLAKAQTLGYRLMHMTALDAATGQPSGGKLFLRNLLQGAIATITLGVGELIISYVSYDGGRTWFDRATGVVVIDDSRRASERLIGRSLLPPKPAISNVRKVTEPEPPAGATEVIDSADKPITASPLQGPVNVVSDHAPIQSIPGRETKSPAPSPAPSQPTPVKPAAGPPAAEPPAAEPPAAEPRRAEPLAPAVKDSGMITATPFGGHRTPPPPPPPPAERPQPVIRSTAPVPDSDHTVVEDDPLPGQVPVIQLDDGTAHAVSAPLALGRNPVAPPAFAGAFPLAVDDPAMKVSKTHLVIYDDGSGVSVLDLHSTNGVRVGRNGAGLTRIPVGEPHHVEPGVRVHLGSRWFEVTP